MAAASSPTLTSTSHTLTAGPAMAPPSSMVNGEALALLEALQPANRHILLQPSAAIPTESLNLVKSTLEAFAAQVADEQQRSLRETRKRKRGDASERGEVLKTRKIYVDGFQTNQVWEQAKRIINGVLSHSESALAELEDRNEIAVNGHVRDSNQPMLEFGEDGFEVDSDDDDNEDFDEDDELDGEEHLNDDDMEGDETLELLRDEDGSIIDDMEDEGDFEEDDEEQEDDGQADEFVEDPNGLNDGFFSIDDFNRQTQWFEDQDARGDPNTDQASDDDEIDWHANPAAAPSKSKQKGGNPSRNKEPKEDKLDEDEGEDDEEDGPTFGNMDLDAPEGDSEDEDLEDGVDDGEERNANDIFFKDFFAPPARKLKEGKPKRNVRFEPQQPEEADVERAIADVRRDLFDDESDNDDSEDALSDVSAGDPKGRRSAHERRQAKLSEEIRKLEAASIAKREWTLSGEAAAVDRPMNSLLEEDLDFEHIGKPVPVITPDISEGIEDLIKRRILAQEFDEVIRRRPDASSVPSSTRRGLIELDDSKADKGLAEIYEEEHVRKTDPDAYVSASDAKLQREEREVEALWRDISGRLDALSSWRYKPKPAAPALSVVADVATIAMEDAQPATAQGMAGIGSGSRMAPQEVYNAASAEAAKGERVAADGLPVAMAEMSRDEKARRRRRDKERAKKAAGNGVGGAAAGGKKGGRGNGGKPGGTGSSKAQMRADTLADLKKGGVKVINRKGEVTDVQGNKTKAQKNMTSGNYKL